MQKINSRDLDFFHESAVKNPKSTNFFASLESLSADLKRNRISFYRADSGLFLTVDRGEFLKLYYVLTDAASPLPEELSPPNKPVVAETPYRWQTPPASVDYLLSRGFTKALSRTRMALSKPSAKNAEGVFAADASQAEEIFALFYSSFDRFTGCLPEKEELLCAVENGRVLAASPDRKPLGALYFDIAGKTALLKNLAVRPEARGGGIGDSLVKSWISLAAEKGCAANKLWVADGNKPAVRLYEKNNFKPDFLRSDVLIKK